MKFLKYTFNIEGGVMDIYGNFFPLFRSTCAHLYGVTEDFGSTIVLWDVPLEGDRRRGSSHILQGTRGRWTLLVWTGLAKFGRLGGLGAAGLVNGNHSELVLFFHGNQVADSEFVRLNLKFPGSKVIAPFRT